MDERDGDVGHRGPGRHGDAERKRGQRSARVERAVDRVDYDPERHLGLAERNLTALLGDRCEIDARLVDGGKLGEHDVLGLAVDDQAAVAALANARVFGALLDRVGAGEQIALRGHHPPAGREPGVRLDSGRQGISHRGPC